MTNKIEFAKWFNEVASPEEVAEILLFCNDFLGTTFEVEKIHQLKNSLHKILSIHSSKDDILNWLEDQDLARIVRVAKAINGLGPADTFKDPQGLTIDSFIYVLEGSNVIDSTLLRRAIRKTLVFSIE